MNTRARLAGFAIVVASAVGVGAIAGELLGPFGVDNEVPTDHDMTGHDTTGHDSSVHTEGGG